MRAHTHLVRSVVTLAMLAAPAGAAAKIALRGPLT